PISGSANAPTSTLTPMSATSQPVIVVPMFAPNTTQTAWASVRSSALTKPTIATITALDDCTIAVIRMPEKRPRTFVRVHDRRIERSALPAESLSPSVSIRMPSRNRPRPPKSDANVVKVTVMSTGTKHGRPKSAALTLPDAAKPCKRHAGLQREKRTAGRIESIRPACGRRGRSARHQRRRIPVLSPSGRVQPRRPNGRRRGRRSIAEVRELERQIELALLEELNHLLQVVALLAGDPHLIALDRRLHLDLRFLDELDDLAGRIGIDSSFHHDLLPRSVQRLVRRLRRHRAHVDAAS